MNNKLKLNPEKTEYILICPNRTKRHYDTINISAGKQVIPPKEHSKILGVYISDTLNWDKHTTILTGQLKNSYRSFNRVCHHLDTDTQRLLYNASIASRMNYCDSIWDHCGEYNKKRLQTIQNLCARKIMKSMPGASAPPLIKKLGWLDLETKRKLHKCVFLHRLIHGTGPNVLKKDLAKFTRTDDNRLTRGTSNKNLLVHHCRTDYLRKSYFYDAIRIWNSLPSNFRRIDNNKTFKENLHKYFLTGRCRDR